MILSVFSKGINGARALSFGLSAKSLCDKTCRMLKMGFCYAENPERIYKDYNRKLRSHMRMNPENLVARAKKEITPRIKWFRFSVSGSLPSRSMVRNWDLFSSELRSLVNELILHKIPVHMPVESSKKARTYRSLLGDLITVRRTIQTKNGLKSFSDPAAYVCGDKPSKSNIHLANSLAREIRSTGKTVVVCPAVFPNKHGTKSKCGQCTACADNRVDLVVYPLH